MKSMVAVLAILLLPVGLGAQPPRPALSPKPLAIRNVTVIDVVKGEAKTDSTVLIVGDRITALGKDSAVKIPLDAQVVEGKGKFLIPGLWDMHAHLPSQEFLRLFIANGVTSVREMGGSGDLAVMWRRSIKEGRMNGPRLLVAGSIVDGPQPVWPLSLAVADERQGRQAAVLLKQRGMDFIKVYSLVPRAAFLGMAAEAKTQGLPFAGHVPYSVSLEEAINAGQRSIEHLDMLWLASSENEEEAQAAIRAVMAQPNATTASVLATVQAQAGRIGAGHSTAKTQGLIALLVEKGVWVTPTLVTQRAVGSLWDSTFTNDPRLKYIPTFLKQSWNPQTDFRLKNITAEERAGMAAAFRDLLQFVGELHRGGVKLLAGTDAQNPYCFPGFSLHDELALFVKAGLTPLEALQTATSEAAKYAGLQDSLGVVEQGKLADLVLLEADPLADITHTRKIAAVILAGKLIDKPELQKLLAAAEAAAR